MPDHTKKVSTVKLIQKLSGAADLMENGLPTSEADPQSQSPQTLAAMFAVAAVVEFLESLNSIQKNPHLILPLTRLVTELNELMATGRHGAMLQARGKLAGASTLSLSERGLRVTAAVAASILEISGACDRTDAANYVAKKLTEHGFTQKRQRNGHPAQIKAATVQGWLKEAKSGLAQHEESHNLFEELLKALPFEPNEISKLDTSSAVQFVDHYINNSVLLAFGHLRDFDYIQGIRAR